MFVRYSLNFDTFSHSTNIIKMKPFKFTAYCAQINLLLEMSSMNGFSIFFCVVIYLKREKIKLMKVEFFFHFKIQKKIISRFYVTKKASFHSRPFLRYDLSWTEKMKLIFFAINPPNGFIFSFFFFVYKDPLM